MLSSRGLEEGLVCTATTCDDTDHTTARAGENLLSAGGELDTSLALIGVVADNGHVVARGTTERTTVTRLILDVGEDGTLRDGVERKNIADSESGVLSGVDELPTVSLCVPPFHFGFILTWPVYMPSLAMKVWVSCLNRYGCMKCKSTKSMRSDVGFSYVAEDDLGKRSTC